MTESRSDDRSCNGAFSITHPLSDCCTAVGRRSPSARYISLLLTQPVLGGDDFDADIAERYGSVNRTLDDDGLDSFVDTLVRRLASFDCETIAAAKA